MIIRSRPRYISSIVVALFTALALLITGCSSDSPDTGGRSSSGTTEITDVLGRKVSLKLPTARILFDGQRMIYTTAILNKNNPGKNIVGWPDDLTENDPDTWQKYTAKFPNLTKIPTTGQTYNNSFSIEKALELRPDVFVISAANFEAAKSGGIIDRLDKAGIPTVVIDYFVDPVNHTIPSIKLMGQLLGRDAQAQSYIDYITSKINMVKTRLAQADATPVPTFLWRAPGYFDCCSSFKDANLAAIVKEAGGENIADAMLKGKQGQISPEAVIKANPQVVIATGANWAPGKTPVKAGGFVPLGYNESPEAAARALQTVVSKVPGFDSIAAVKDKRTYAVWHHFYDSPYNYLALEWFAKAIHPELFRDVNPAEELRELHEKFLPVKASGTFWTQLP